jgi:uncharacterized membrane protein
MSKPPHSQRGRHHPQVEQEPQQHVNSTLVAEWQGPLPPPAALEKFDQIVPGSADRILRMAESEQQHRQAYERDGLAAAVREARRGQYLGAVICLAAVVAAGIAVYVGSPGYVPVALVGVPVVAMVIAIVRARSKD